MTFVLPQCLQQGRAPRKKAKKKVTKKAAKKAAAGKREAFCVKKKVVLRIPTGEDPNQIRDPKTDAVMIEAAFRKVGTEKAKRNVYLKKYKSGDSTKTKVVDAPTRRGAGNKRPYGWPKNAAYLTVCYGGGVDSTAIIVGLDQLWRETGDPKWIPRAITFADTGGEHPESYRYIEFMDKALKGMFRGGPHHPGKIVKVAYSSLQRGGGWGTGYTLEVQCLVNQTAPSISMGEHSCSTKNKIDAQKHWFDQQFELYEETGGRRGLPLPENGEKILRAIGYDATEKNRLKSGGTYVAKDEQEGPFQGWYPLIEWRWDRARCIAEICAAIGKAPRKSSCFFCGYMKPEELVMLGQDHPDLLKRALFIERVWFHGRNPPRPGGPKGLMRAYSLTDFVLANVGPGSTLRNRQKLVIMGGVAHISPKGQTSVHSKTLGKPEPDKLEKGEFYVQPCGQLMSKSEVACLDELAKEWCRSAPDKGKRIWGWSVLKKDEKVKGRKTKKVTRWKVVCRNRVWRGHAEDKRAAVAEATGEDEAFARYEHLSGDPSDPVYEYKVKAGRLVWTGGARSADEARELAAEERGDAFLEGSVSKGAKRFSVEKDGTITMVWDLIVNKAKAGQLDKDMSLSSMAMTIPGFCDLLGFRTKRGALSFYDLSDLHLPNARRTDNRFNEQKIKKILSGKTCRRPGKCWRARNPRGLPTPRNPMLAGMSVVKRLPVARNPEFLPPAAPGPGGPHLPAGPEPRQYFVPGVPATEAFVPFQVPEHAHTPPRVQFELLAQGQQPFVYMPPGTVERPAITRALYELLASGYGMATPAAWEDLLAAVGQSAKLFVIDGYGERWEVRDVLFDYGGETGELILRHLGRRSREGDFVVDLQEAYGRMLPVVVYKPPRSRANAPRGSFY